MSEPPELSSPFALLGEIEEAKELLVLSYTTSLDFFERFTLSHARASGAVVTVISDATMTSADPVMVNRAGAAYLDARAVCPGGASFHPKLFVLAGEQEARVAIGSGNLTLAGWHANAELLTVLRADAGGGPETIRDVGAFLRRLAASPVVFGPGAEQALDRVGERLLGLPVRETGPRLLDNLAAPIAEALPAGAVEQLTCCAPYFDADLAALRWLIERFQPQRLTVLVEERTRVDGMLLDELVQEHGGELRWISDRDRFHHGKLIEWSADGRRWALTGSPNLSGRALLRALSEGANCELALLTEVPASLAPPSEPLPEGEVFTLVPPASEEAGAATVLLAAVRHEGKVHLHLTSPLEEAGLIQHYDIAGDGWLNLAPITPGHDRYTLDSGPPPGRAVRVLLDSGASSNTVFVTDMARATQPQAKAIGRVRGTIEAVALEGLWPQLLADIEELRPHLLRVGALVPAPAGEDGAEGDGSGEQGDAPAARPVPGQDLEAFLAACEPVLGREMSRFALALPAVPGVDVDFDGAAAGLDGDLGDDAAAEAAAAEAAAEPGLAGILARLPERERARARRWIERLVASAAGMPMIVRTLALRCVLHGIEEGIWIEEDAEAILLRASSALAAPGDEPREEEGSAAGSLAAMAATWMRGRVDRLSVRDERTLRYERLAAAVRPLLPLRSTELIEALAEGMPEPAVGIGWVDACEIVAAEIVEPDQGAHRAVRLLDEEHDVEAEVGPDGAIIVLTAVPPRAEPSLCLALGLADEEGPLKVRGQLPKGAAATAAWRAPYLAVERQGARRWGSLYRLGDNLSPLHYGRHDRSLPKPKASWQGDEPRPAIAEELLAASGSGSDGTRTRDLRRDRPAL